MENESTRDIKRIITQPSSEEYMMPREFLNRLFNEEKDNIRMALAQVREDNPKFYLRTMLEVGKLVIPKTGNIRHDVVNHDMDELSALAKSYDRPMIDVDNSSYIEEITPWENAARPVHPDITDTPDEIVSSLPVDD